MYRVLKVTFALLALLVACRSGRVPGRNAAQAIPPRQDAAAPIWVTGEFIKMRGKTTRPDCLKISHVGSQDHPIGSVEMCPGSRGRATGDPLWMDWLFEFDSVTFDSIRSLLQRQEIPPPRTGPVEFGTFLLTWDGSLAQRKAILLPIVACRILGDLSKVVSTHDYAAFVEQVSNLRISVRCAEPQAKKE